MYIIWPYILLFGLGHVHCWDSNDLEVFDVVEEVGENFYTFLGVNENATISEIKKAFRKLSLVYHPDRNKADDAETKFRQLAAVHDILRDPKKRAIYSDVLVNGLPDWKHVIYYYRRVRKMELAEMSVILFVIITVGQYLVAWAAYFEKRYAIQEFINTKKKSLARKQKKGKIEHGTVEMLPEMLVSSIPKPTVACTLPVQIVKLVWFLVVVVPPLSYQWIKNYIKTKSEKVESEEEQVEEEEVVVVKERGPRRRKGGFQAPEVKEDSSGGHMPVQEASQLGVTPAPVIKGGLWTDNDFEDLIRLMKKYPAGTQDRWDKIGESMMRAAGEVAHMAHKIKGEGFNPFKQPEEVDPVPAVPKKVKTRGGKGGEENNSGGGDASWSQAQQKALETALAKFPKGCSGDRWEKITACVPGKTKDECLQRFKYLANIVKKKKEFPAGEDKEPTSSNLETQYSQDS